MKLSAWIAVVLALNRAALQIFFVCATIAFYALAITQLITHALQAQMGSIRQNRWNVFCSVLFHCFTPNFFLLAAIPDSVCSAAMSNSVTSIDGLSNFDVFCVHVFAITQFANPPRLFVISTSALIAFEEYRRAILEVAITPFFCLRRRKNASATLEEVSEVSSSAE